MVRCHRIWIADIEAVAGKTKNDVEEYLMINSVGFNYDKTFDSDSDRGLRLHDGGSIHFYNKDGIFYLGSVFLMKI